MKRASKFAVSPGWQLLLRDMQLDPVVVLKLAQLPVDLFSRPNAWLTPSEYFRLFEAVGQITQDQPLGILLAESLSTEAFDPAVFACLCSRNFAEAVARISQYKVLIGPLVLDVQPGSERLLLSLSCYGNRQKIPSALAVTELAFFTQLVRLATREAVNPIAITLPELPEHLDAYRAYFGCDLVAGDVLSIAFSTVDAERPFLTANAAMWDFFELGLNQRLQDLKADASTADKVRAVLLEALPSGESSAEFVAGQLAISKRTLQRKLGDEGISYQAILTAVRSELADHYLEKSRMSLGEISFLLGFQESNSFIRAYSGWKGISPGQYRERQYRETCH